MGIFEGIVALVISVGVPLAGWIARQVQGTKKLTRCQVLASGKKLAWGVVEGMKTAGPGGLTQDGMLKAGRKAFLEWSEGEGLKITGLELQAAEVAFRQLSTAAKALRK